MNSTELQINAALRQLLGLRVEHVSAASADANPEKPWPMMLVIQLEGGVGLSLRLDSEITVQGADGAFRALSPQAAEALALAMDQLRG